MRRGCWMNADLLNLHSASCPRPSGRQVLRGTQFRSPGHSFSGGGGGGHKTLGALNFDHGALFQRGRHKTLGALNFDHGALFQRGRHKTKRALNFNHWGTFSANIMYCVKLFRKGHILGCPPKWGRSRFRHPCTGVPSRLPPWKSDCQKRNLISRC